MSSPLVMPVIWEALAVISQPAMSCIATRRSFAISELLRLRSLLPTRFSPMVADSASDMAYMLSSSGTSRSTMSVIRSVMALVSSTSEPMGMDTLMETVPWSISGIRTILVDKQHTAKIATMPTDTSIPVFRW